MLSMRPKKAVLKARKRQELSSGIMRRRRVEVWEGRGSSGGSVSMVVGLRVKERGGFGGAVPTSAKENDAVALVFEGF